MVRWALVEHLKVQELKYTPLPVRDEYHLFKEETVLSEWIKLHLNWLKWYCTVALDPSTPLEELLDPPVVELRTSKSKQKAFLFFFMFRLYDLVRRASVPLGT